MKQELTRDNVAQAARACGYDHDKADWPRWYPGQYGPAEHVTSRMVRQLGWHPLNRHARIIVGSTLHGMEFRARQ